MFSRNFVIRILLLSLVATGSPVFVQGSSLNDPTAPPGFGKRGPTHLEKRKQQRPFILQSTIVSSQRRLALINNRIYLEGDTVDGARLVRVLPEEAILVRGQNSIRLKLSGQPVKAERKPASRGIRSHETSSSE